MTRSERIFIASCLLCLSLGGLGGMHVQSAEHPRVANSDDAWPYAPGKPPSPPPADLGPGEDWIPANTGQGPTLYSLRGFILADGRICLNTWDAGHKVILGLRCK